MNFPVQSLKHFLTQAVTVARRFGGVIRSAVALDAKDVAAFLVRMDDAEINTIFRDADLRVRFIPRGFQTMEEPALEIAVRLCTRLRPGEVVPVDAYSRNSLSTRTPRCLPSATICAWSSEVKTVNLRLARVKRTFSRRWP
jgi:hypothetical protein